MSLDIEYACIGKVDMAPLIFCTHALTALTRIAVTGETICPAVPTTTPNASSTSCEYVAFCGVNTSRCSRRVNIPIIF